MQRDLEQPAALARVLRSLPEDAAAPYGWGEFQHRAARRVLARPSRAGTVALAALTAIAAGIVAISLRLDHRAQQAQWRQQAPRAVLEAREAPDAGGGAANAHPGADVPFGAARTEMLERWLASLPDNPPLVQVGPRAAVTGLEDRLAEVDDLLSAERIDQARPAHLLALQQERRLLVSSLAQVRYAEELVDESR
jgi:hypothetical protein